MDFQPEDVPGTPSLHVWPVLVGVRAGISRTSSLGLSPASRVCLSAVSNA